MKKHKIISTLLISLLTSSIATIAHAETAPLKETASSASATPAKPSQPTKNSANQTAWRPQALFTFSEGSLKKNIEQAAEQFGWNKIVWQPKQDYQWVGETQISATSFSNLLTKVLENYPLQAVFYKGNHVLVITSRNIR